MGRPGWGTRQGRSHRYDCRLDGFVRLDYNVLSLIRYTLEDFSLEKRKPVKSKSNLFSITQLFLKISVETQDD